MAYEFVNVRNFTPNLPGGVWQSVGNLSGFTRAGNAITLQAAPASDGAPRPAPVISFLSDTAFRVRFNPSGSFGPDASYAVVNQQLGPLTLSVSQVGSTVVLSTPAMRVVIDLSPYRLSVYRGAQLIHADAPDYNLVYIPGQEVVANFKVYPPNARYFGFGEKAGAQLAKNELTMTFFNFDNFSYSQGPLPLNNEQGPLNPSEPLYCSVPFLLELNPNPQNGAAYAYGLFFDNAAQSYFNLGASDYSDMSGKYYFGALYGDLNYYFLLGNEAPDVLQQYATLTGLPPLPPRYVFGYHQGCYGYYSSGLLTDVANAFRANHIPIDGLHIDVDFQDNYRTFTSSARKFPSVAQVFADLHRNGFKMSTNITPLCTNVPQDESGGFVPYATLQSGLNLATGSPSGAFIPLAGSPDPNSAFVGTVSYGNNPGSNPFQAYPVPTFGDPIRGAPLGADGYYPDFGQPAVRAWWGQQYNYLLGLGLDMIWQDMTCPALKNTGALTFPLDLKMTDIGGQRIENARMHNGYVSLLLRATFDGVNQTRPAQRNFIIARGGYAGMQRYAGLWTGDSASTWDFLRINIPEVLNLGLSGVPISGCDIGGFANSPGDPGATLSGGIGSPMINGVTNYELFTRWMQLGSFLPWYRNHYNGYSKQFQEPYNYGAPVPDNCRKYIELRYRMMHVYYSAMYEASQTGAPIARPLFYNSPDGRDLRSYDFANDQFFVGRDFLVAPIIDPHETVGSAPLRNVYLPAGSDWYAFMDNQQPLAAAVSGGTLVTNYYAPLNLVPIYVRAGAILPFCELEQWVGQLNSQNLPNPITFNVYPGPDRSFDLYLDDGISTNAPHRLTRVSQRSGSGARAVRLERVRDNYAPREAHYFVAFLGESQAPGTLSVGGAQLPNVGTPQALAESTVSAYYWNQSIQVTFAKVFDTASDVTVTRS
jgi:alpha-glucosidase